jgi:DNA-binding MurR/RpiR family transcriptional regulator
MNVYENLFALMNEYYSEMTPAQKKVADFILENPLDTMHITITDLAQQCGVGDTSVFRLCKLLGLKGYQDLKIALTQTVYASSKDSFPGLDEKISRGDKVDTICKKLLSSNLAVLNETYNLLKINNIQRAVDILLKAKRIYFFGVGSSAIIAMEANDRFMRTTDKTDFTFDSHFQAMRAALMTPEDTAVAFSYSGKTEDTCHTLEIARACGAKIICVTRYARSPIAKLSDVVLLCGGEKGNYQNGALSAAISQYYLIDILYTSYYVRLFDQSVDNKKKTLQAVVSKRSRLR